MISYILRTGEFVFKNEKLYVPRRCVTNIREFLTDLQTVENFDYQEKYQDCRNIIG